MAITKKQKTELMSAYTDDLKQAQNVVLVKQLGLPVNDFNRLRMGVVEAGGKVAVIRKTLFNRVIEQEGFEPGGMMDSEGSIFALYAIEKEFDPMKVIVTSQKLYKKGQKKFTVDFVGGWFDKQWKDGAYVSELANLPTKPELVAKFLFLLKYPVQSFVMTLDQISKKNAS